MTGRGRLVAGPTLILMGILLLAGHSVHWETFGVLWLFLGLAAGVVQLGLFAQGRRHPSILAGGVLLTLLALHLLALRWGWVSFDSSWPFFLLAPGLALLAVASSDRGNRDALTPAIVLIGMAVFCYLFTLGIFALILRVMLGLVKFAVKYILPILLIVWGIWLLLDRRRAETTAEVSDVAPAPVAPVKVEVQVEFEETPEPVVEVEDAEYEETPPPVSDEPGEGVEAEEGVETSDELKDPDEGSPGPRFT